MSSVRHCSHHMQQCGCIACCDDCDTCCPQPSWQLHCFHRHGVGSLLRGPVGSNTVQTNSVVEPWIELWIKLICDSLVQFALVAAPCALCLHSVQVLPLTWTSAWWGVPRMHAGVQWVGCAGCCVPTATVRGHSMLVG